MCCNICDAADNTVITAEDERKQLRIVAPAIMELVKLAVANNISISDVRSWIGIYHRNQDERFILKDRGFIDTYKVIRSYVGDHPSETIVTNLTLEEAQELCKCPDGNSHTCTSVPGIASLHEKGHWFLCYRIEE
jgi:hypothetical protein